jgi:hypothetical protein
MATIKNGWVEGDIFGFTAEQDLIPRPGGKALIKMPWTGKGVLHTTEGMSLKVALATLHAKHAAPHFTLGENRIVQNRPLGFQSAALIDPGNRLAYVQIETVSYTGGSKDYNHHAMDSWQMVDSTRLPLIALMAFLDREGIVPLKRAYPWPDDCKDIKGIWATTGNSRRQSGHYNDPALKGWFYHLEVPNNSHYDCGGLRFAELQQGGQLLLSGGVQPSVVTEETDSPAPVISAVVVTHEVQAGESWNKIAGIYGVSPTALARSNNLTLESTIHPRQILTIP